MPVPNTRTRARRLPALRTAAVIAAAVAALSTACSAQTRQVRTTVTRTVTAAPAGAPVSPLATPAQLYDPPVLPLGSSFLVGGSLEVTVLRYASDVARGAPVSGVGRRWDAVDVRMCVSETTIVGWAPWSLVDSQSGESAPSTVTFDEFPRPLFPVVDWPVLAHRCAQGWIVFDVVGSARIVLIQYSRRTADGRGIQIAVWRP